MIYSNITLTVTAGVSRTNERIILYRGDREVEVIFEILQSAFKFAKGENVIENTKAAFGQLIIDRPDKDFIFSEMTECEDGKVKFVITGEMIDDLGEVGLYGIQIRLFDEAKTSRITLPPVMDAIEVREPISEEPTTIDEAIIDYSMVARGGIVEDPFDDSDSYNKTNWVSGDKITAVKMNKLENAMYEVNEKVEGIAIPSLDGYATKNYVDSAIDEVDVSSQLGDYAKLSQVPTKTSQLVNDSGFLTEAPDLSNYVTNASLKGVENAYKAADTTLQNNINSLDAAYKAADTTLQNNINSLDAAYKAADVEIQNEIDALDTAYKAADTTLQNNIDDLDTAYKAADVEIQNSIPTKISQLEYDINDNLISNGRFVGAKPEMVGTDLESWVMWGDIQTYRVSAYNDVTNALALQFTKKGASGGIHQTINDYRLSPGNEMTLSFYCDWQPNVSDPEYVIKFQLDNVDVESTYGFCIKGNQSYTFTVPDIEFNAILVGFKSELGLKEDMDSYVNMYLNNVKLEVGDKATAWCEKQHNIATKQYVDKHKYCTHGANGLSATTGYVKVCSIKVLDIYINSPIIIKFARRRDEVPKEVIINFNNQDNLDPGILSFYIRGRSGGVAYMHKSAPSIYDLWIEKTEAYDHIGLLDVQMTKYQADRVEMTYTNDHANELPEGYIRPQAYNGFYVPEEGDWFNNGTPTIGLNGGMEIGLFLDFHQTNAHTDDYGARLSTWGGGTLVNYGAFVPNTNDNYYTIGTSNNRWYNMYLHNQPNVSSDRTLKENITYVKSEKAKSNSTDEVVTYEDMYDFVKDDLELATYNFKGQEEQNMNFIAQDLLYNLDGTDNKIGQMIINPVAPPTEEEIEEAKSNMHDDQEYTYPTLSYDMGMYISVLAGALKTALNKIDKLEDEIKELKNK